MLATLVFWIFHSDGFPAPALAWVLGVDVRVAAEESWSWVELRG